MKTVTLRASAAQEAGTETGDTINVINMDADDKFEVANFILDVTAAATDAGDTLDVYVDVSPDQGTTWVNAIHFTQVLGNGGAKKELARLTSFEGLNDPDATLSVAADAASGVVRNIGMLDYIRYRSTVVNASTDNESFTFSLIANFR